MKNEIKIKVKPDEKSLNEMKQLAFDLSRYHSQIGDIYECIANRISSYQDEQKSEESKEWR